MLFLRPPCHQELPRGTAVAPLLLSGRVVDASGAPLAAAAVVAYTLPVDLNGLRPGDAIPEVEIGRTTSDSNGRFTLTVENTKSADGAITELAADLGGHLNAELRIIATDGTTYISGFTRDTVPVPSGSTSPRTRSGLKLTRGSSSVPMKGYVARIDPRQTGVFTTTPRIGALATQTAPRVDDIGCYWLLDQNLADAYGRVIEAHHWDNKIKGNTEYHSGTQTQFQSGLAGALSGGPDPATWAIGAAFYTGGSATSSSAATTTKLDASTSAGGKTVEANFRKVQEAYSCSIIGIRQYRRRATNWNGYDLRYGDNIWGKDGLCDTTYASNSHVYPNSQASWSKTSAAGTWEGGALDLGPLVVASQTTWDTSVTANYYFNTQHILCGSNAAPANAAKVFAGK